MTLAQYLVVGLVCLIPPAAGLLAAWVLDWLVWGKFLANPLRKRK